MKRVLRLSNFTIYKGREKENPEKVIHSFQFKANKC